MDSYNLEEGEVASIIDNLIEHIIGNVDVVSLMRKDNISPVEFMEKKECFLVKGAMDKVADQLSVSKVTI